MIKVFQLNDTFWIYQRTGESIRVTFKDSSCKTMLNNSLLKLNVNTDNKYNVDKFESLITSTRILGFKNKLNGTMISVKEYHRIFPNEILETEKAEFYNPSWELSQFHQQHTLLKENYHKEFKADSFKDYKYDETNFRIVPYIFDDNSLGFRGSLNFDKLPEFKKFNFKEVYSYEFIVVSFGLDIQYQTLKTVSEEFKLIQKVKSGFDSLTQLLH